MKKWLSNQPAWVVTLFALAGAFGTYFSMYAFRKPFTAAAFDGLVWLGLGLKSWLVIAQTVGYATAKFVGIKLISEVGRERRGLLIAVLIAISWVSLLGFAVSAEPFSILFLFFNGLLLGLIWGLVFSFLEGRRASEILGAGLAVSFIISSGVVKSVGAFLMLNNGISEFWMPAATGFLFFPLLFLSVWLLECVPPPTAADQTHFGKRSPMNAAQRFSFLKKYGFGLACLVVGYVGLTIFRDFRDNFSAELWKAVGFGSQPAVFSQTEIPVALGVLAVLSLTIFFKKNRSALLIQIGLVLLGVLLVGGSTVLFENQKLGVVHWQIAVGVGLYLAYVPFNALIFDRLVAATRQPATAGFLIYVADSFGYLGGVVVLCWKNFAEKTLDWLPFFIQMAYALALLGALSFGAGLLYFWKKALPT